MVPMMIILILMMMIGLLQLVHLRIVMMPKFGMTSYVKDVNWMMTTYVKDDDSDRTYVKDDKSYFDRLLPFGKELSKAIGTIWLVLPESL